VTDGNRKAKYYIRLQNVYISMLMEVEAMALEITYGKQNYNNLAISVGCIYM